MGWVMDIGILVGGVIALLAGGEVLVRGAVALALRLGVPAIVVGLTVVAFGTSAPELALNVTAAIKGATALAFGNVIGSNIANIGLILGLAALWRPLRVNAGVIRRELPFLMVLSTAALVMALAAPGAPMSGASWEVVEQAVGELWSPGFGRGDGVVLLLMFVLFSWLTVMPERARRKNGRGDDDPFRGEVEELSEGGRGRPAWQAGVMIGGGLVSLCAGGWLAERGATGLAEAMGLGDEIIGLTVVAIATSLPELATSIAAVRQNQVDIAVGNVVGSNIFNLALVLGVTALVSPVGVPAGGLVALGFMALLTFALIPVSLTRGRHISRLEGGALLLTYLAFLAVQVATALRASGAQGVGAG